MSQHSNTTVRVGWRSPANIALVKYWGKHGRQLPANPSISFTLSRAFTETLVEFSPKDHRDAPILKSFTFAGAAHEAFARKMERLLESITDMVPFLEKYQLSISSDNSFPHSAGIASSASAMSALALCLVEGEYLLEGEAFDPERERNRISEIARLCSGSASRSVFPHLAVWGTHSDIEGSTDRYAIAFPYEVHPVFDRWKDDILLVSEEVKAVSSSAGHELMNHHLYAPVRYDQARANIRDLSRALQEGDVERFGQIVEEEAMTLHGLMMNSRPSYMLLLPETVRIIHELRRWRAETGYPVYFTLDAGPNVHLLYPQTHREQVDNWMQEHLQVYLDKGRILRDEVGEGPFRV